MSNLQVQIASGDALDVRQFSVNARMSSLFQVDVVVRSDNPSIDFDEVVGLPAMFAINYGGGVRFWRGICSDIQLVRVAHERPSLLDAGKAVGKAIAKGKAAKEAVEDAVDLIKNPDQLGDLVDGPFGLPNAAGKVVDIAAKVGAAVTSALDLRSMLSGGSSAHTYHLSIVPELWLCTQRRNYKIFQQESELDIVLKLLKKHWEIEPILRLGGTYKKRKYRVQYAESDYAFICRMLEDAGISFFFEEDQTNDNPALWENKLIFCDAPQDSEARAPHIPFREEPGAAGDKQHVTGVRMGQQVRPGRYVIGDRDYRRPAGYKLIAEAEGGLDVENKLERFHFIHGFSNFTGDQAASTPVADDRGVARTDEGEGKLLAKRRLAAKRGSAFLLTFETNAHDLAPGMVMGMLDHPHDKLNDEALFLIIDGSLSGSANGEWSHHCEARSCLTAYHPSLVTPKPRTHGIESATVVGPSGEEIHVDEFGRVRVHFHWDRDSQMNEKSSCWVPVSQSWAGTNYGWSTLPRIGQEVIVDFLGADPDRPVVIGRVYTGLQRTPYALPANKTKSGWKSNSTPGGGGFNEISFEDKKGKELVYMQAEKNLRRLVKNNESVNVGANRSHSVGCNDSLTVGANRTHTVGVNETIAVGGNSVMTTAKGQNMSVGSLPPPADGKPPPPPPNGELKLEVENKISLICGASKLVLDKSGKVTLDGTEFVFTSSGKVTVDSKVALFKSSAETTVEAGADLTIQGGPMVHINPP